MLTPVEEIRNRLMSYDRAYYDQIYRQTRYLFGDPFGGKVGVASSGDDDFPAYRDLVVRALKIGESRRILNTSVLTLSRVMSSEPEPEFPQVDRITAELRKQFFLERFRGAIGAADGSWDRQLQDVFLEGDNLGLGFAQVGPKRNRQTRMQYVHLRHVPLLQVIWDRHERTPSRARWMAFVHYVAPEDAVAAAGKEVLSFQRTVFESAATRPLGYVRATEYFDLGYGDGEPTMAVFWGPWSEEPKVRRTNPFGIPAAWYEYVSIPQMRRPIGKIMLQMATQEGLNELEQHLRTVVRRGTGFDLVDATQLDPRDLERLNDGDLNVRVRIVKPVAGTNPYIRIPNQEVGSALIQLLSIYERQYNADSGTTELDRGSFSQAARTLGENELLDSKSAQQGVLTKRETLNLYRRTVETSLRIAAIVDRDPIRVDVFGTNITINDPSRPEMRVDRILAEPSRVLIGQQAVESQDLKKEQAQRAAALSTLTPFVGKTIDPAWFTEEMLKAIGEKDPKAAMMAPAIDPSTGEPVPQAAPVA